MVGGRHSLVLLDATAFEKLERGYLWMVAAIVHCGHRPQPMKSQGGYLLLDATAFEKLEMIFVDGYRQNVNFVLIYKFFSFTKEGLIKRLN